MKNMFRCLPYDFIDSNRSNIEMIVTIHPPTHSSIRPCIREQTLKYQYSFFFFFRQLSSSSDINYLFCARGETVVN